MVSFIQEYEPRFFRRNGIRSGLTTESKALRRFAEEFVEDVAIPDEADVARGDGAVYSALGSAVSRTSFLESDDEEASALQALAERCAESARKLEEHAATLEAKEGSDDADQGVGWEGASGSTAGFDVDAVFSDF